MLPSGLFVYLNPKPSSILAKDKSAIDGADTSSHTGPTLVLPVMSRPKIQDLRCVYSDLRLS